jgi:long-chain acyl-CoA synthetase
MKIVETIRRETSRLSDHTAMIEGDRRVTYGQLLGEVSALSEVLAAGKVGSGKRIAFHCADGIDYVIGALALLECGAAVVPMANSLADDEVRETLERIEVDGVLLHHSLPRQPGEHDARPINHIFLFQSRTVANGMDPCRTIDAAFIRFSSGTTGESKGVVLSHQTIIDRTDAANRGLQITDRDVILWVLSMSHHFVVSILLFLRKGATIVIGNQFFPFSVIDAARSQPITFIYGSPVHYHLLSVSDAVSRENLEDVRLAVSTSMKMPPEISASFAAKFGFAPAEAYGIIEIGLPFINTEPGSTPTPTVGRALPDYQLRIDHPDAQGVGEVLVKGKGMFDAYFHPWRTRDQVAPGGWFDTGDLGRLDDQNRLYLVGRSKTVLVCAGMKVFPEEVEEVINSAPGVRESLVMGRDHPQFGQVPVAAVVMNDDSTPQQLEDLRAFCFRHLSSYKVPVEFTRVDSLAKTPSGKLARSH